MVTSFDSLDLAGLGDKKGNSLDSGEQVNGQYDNETAMGVLKRLTEPHTELTSLVEIKSRLAAIEQAQGVLCERLDAALQDSSYWNSWRKHVNTALDEIRGALLEQQFKANQKGARNGKNKRKR